MTTRTEYDAIDGRNFSLLKELFRSPRHFQHRLKNPRPDADPLRLGRAGHTATFEPQRFLADYVLWTGGRRQGNDWAEFKADAERTGRTVLTEDQYDLSQAIAAAVRAHPVAAEYLAQGEAEKTLVWTDKATGLKLKGRADWLSTSKPGLVDLKTTRAIDDRAFSATVARFHYAAQMAMYLRGVKAITGQEPPAILIAVESAPPHDVAVYRLDEAALAVGDDEVTDLLAKYLAHTEADNWPGAHPEEEALSLPAWADTGAVEDPDWMTEEAA